MKILFIGNWAEMSGWSTQQVNHILALDNAGVQVIPRNINILNNRNSDLPERIKQLQNQDDSNPDIILLNTLPSLYEKTYRAKTIGYYVCETNFKMTGWQHNINLLDHAIVPCYYNKELSVDSGVTTKISIVPEAIDINKLNVEYPVHPIRSTHRDKFIFLTVSEWTSRKNIEAIIKAFHLEFHPTEDVELVIKTTPIGMSNPEQDINNRVNDIKRGLKLYANLEQYKKENIMCGFLSEQDMYSLYQTCDAYVCASRAEAFCIPIAIAMGMGRAIISPDHTGLDYINDKNSFVVKSFEQSCFGALDQMPDLYTGIEHWYEVSIPHLRLMMRQAYEHRGLALKKKQSAKETVKKYSIENVGKIYKEILERTL